MRLARRHGVENKSIFELGKLESGSKIKDRQFLALRVIWRINEADKFDAQWALDKDLAREHLQKVADWENYTARSDKGPVEEVTYLGTFDMLWHYQQLVDGLMPEGPDANKITVSRPVTRSMARQVARANTQFTEVESPSKGRGKALSTTKAESRMEDLIGDLAADTADLELSDSERSDVVTHPILHDTPFNVLRFGDQGDYSEGFLPVEDEQIVNTALILLLQGVCLRARGVGKVEWTLQRKSFSLKRKEGPKEEEADKANDEENESTEVFQARTDGHLRITLNGKSKSLAILEVKTRPRKSCKPFMQDSAQMAAWIHAEPDAKNNAGKYRYASSPLHQFTPTD